MELIVYVPSVAVQEKIIEVMFVVFPELGELRDMERARTLGTSNNKKITIKPSFFIFLLKVRTL